MSDETTPQTEAQQPETVQEATATPETFDGWIVEQDDMIRDLFEQHVGGLKSALDAERNERKKFEKQLRDVTGKMDKNSEAAQQLQQVTGELAEYQRKTSFYEQAATAGVPAKNFRLAYLAAQDMGAFGDNGEVDLGAIKEAHPVLFNNKPAPPATSTAGAGTSAPPARPVNMTDILRGAFSGKQ
jgi:hypothetical protein